jgi:hypothetical protein
LLPCVDISTDKAEQKLCSQIDSFTENSFSKQANLRALSRRLVTKITNDHQIALSPESISTHFSWPKREFRSSVQFLKRYGFRTQKDQAWLEALNRLRVKSRFSDAVFLPLVIRNRKAAAKTKSTLPAQNAVWVALLIDPLSGNVLWAKEATGITRGQADKNIRNKALAAQLFRAGFWQEFPGWAF